MRRWLAIVERSMRQCSIEAPGFIRANTLIILASRLAMVCAEERNGHAEVGMYTSFSLGYCGSGGKTPITVCTRSFIS